MGAVFNTPGTMMIIGLLGNTFTASFSKTAKNKQLIADLDPNSGMSSYDFCKKYGLIATGKGSASINAHWKTWLHHFDANGGDQVRAEMVKALNDAATFEAIEFFPYPDAAFLLSTSPTLNNSGKCSLIVTAETPTYDQL